MDVIGLVNHSPMADQKSNLPEQWIELVPRDALLDDSSCCRAVFVTGGRPSEGSWFLVT